MESPIILGTTDQEEWDSFVERHPLGCISHLSSWNNVLMRAFPHIEGRFIAIRDDVTNKIVAGLPIYQVRSWILGNRLVSVPNATISDPLVENAEQLRILLALSAEMQDRLGYSRIEVRTTNCAPLFDTKTFRMSSLYKHHFLSLEGDLNRIFLSFHRTSIRQLIKKAETRNLTIRIATGKEDLSIFYRLYQQTRRRLGLPAWPQRYFDAIWDTFHGSEQVLFFISEFSGTPVCASMVFKFNDRVSVESLGWDRAFHGVSPTVFMYWEVLKAAHSWGFRFFDLGRTSIFNRTLLDFKRRWGTQETEISDFVYPVSASGTGTTSSEVTPKYKLMKTILKASPRFLYELLSDITYRHLG